MLNVQMFVTLSSIIAWVSVRAMIFLDQGAGEKTARIGKRLAVWKTLSVER